MEKLNALKSQLSEEQHPKLTKTLNVDRINMLKQQIAEIQGCKHVKREGESCTLNNGCKFPNCE